MKRYQVIESNGQSTFFASRQAAMGYYLAIASAIKVYGICEDGSRILLKGEER